MSDRWICSLTSSIPSVDLVGGKAVGLSRLHAAGLPVPGAFAISTVAFQDAAGAAVSAAEALLEGVDQEDEKTIASRSEQARKLLFEATAGHPVLDRVVEEYEALAGEATGGVAVRSSGVDEDGAQSSYAGGHDSYLCVRDSQRLTERVRQCWASLFTDRAVHYRLRFGRKVQGMGVVVQKMVAATSSGVLMTLNPSSGDRSVMVVESVWGLGEALVSGEVTPDRYVVNKVTGQLIRQTVSCKATQVISDPTEGTTAQPLSTALMNRPSLDERQLGVLHSWIERIEQHVGGCADVEFAVENDHVWCLQIRPETYWSNQPRRRPDARGTALQAILATLKPRSSAAG